MRLSIVVPALDEAGQIAATLASARGPRVAEVIVVDGGSADDTAVRARAAGAAALTAGRGRGR